MHSSRIGPSIADLIERAAPIEPSRPCHGRAARANPDGHCCRGRGSSPAMSRRPEFPPRPTPSRLACPVSSASASWGWSSSRSNLGQLGHAAARINPGRHVLDADDHTRCPRMLGQLTEPARERARRRFSLLGRRQSAGMDNQVAAHPHPPANRRMPSSRRSIRDASTASRRSQVDTPCPDRSPAPAAMRTMDRQTTIGRLPADQCRIGQATPLRQDFQDRSPDPDREIQLVVELDLRIAVCDHGAEESWRHEETLNPRLFRLLHVCFLTRLA